MPGDIVLVNGMGPVVLGQHSSPRQLWLQLEILGEKQRQEELKL